MSKLENLEEQVKELTGEELRAFREWFVQFDAEAWDRQIQSDAQSGKLDELAARALRDYDEERSTTPFPAPYSRSPTRRSRC
jgi:hypothetical protein